MRAETALPIVEDHAKNRSASQTLDRLWDFGARRHTHNLRPRITFRMAGLKGPIHLENRAKEFLTES